MAARGYGSPRGGGRGGRGGGGMARGGGSPPSRLFMLSTGVPPPDANVTRTEDQTQLSRLRPEALPLDSLSIGDASMPIRPAYGTQGKKVVLWANYFHLKAPRNLLMHRYSIDFQPDRSGKIPAGKKARWIVQLLLEQFFPLLYQSRTVVTDYANTIISQEKLDLAALSRPRPAGVFHVRYHPEGSPPAAPGATNQGINQVIVREHEDGSILSMEDLVAYVTSTNINDTFAKQQDTIQALNIVLGFHPKSSKSTIMSVRNSYYPIDANMKQFTLGGGLNALRGYLTSARLATNRLLLNVQVKHAATYQVGQLDELVDVWSSANKKDTYKLQSFLKTLRVKMLHPNRNAAGETVVRMKTIHGLAAPGDGRVVNTVAVAHPPIIPRHGANATEVKFWLDSEPGTDKYITVEHYFSKQHNFLTHAATMPVVNVGNRSEPIYVPLDVCEVLQGTPYNARLSPDQTAQMIKFAVRLPSQNANSITTIGPLALGMRPSMNSTLQSYGVTTNASLITVHGRVLTAPSVLYRGKKQAATRFGKWNMQGITFNSTTTLPSWTVLRISIENQRDAWPNDHAFKSTLDSFCSTMQACGLQIGQLTFPGPSVNLKAGDEHKAANNLAIENIFRNAKNHKSQPKLLLVILPRKDTAIYNQVKLIGDIRAGMHTICVVGSKFATGGPQYYANVALKFNLKLGGVNQALLPAKLGLIEEGKTMIVGLDVTHPSPGSAKTAPSVAAIVASVDKSLGQWPADIRVQTGRQEMVANLEEMFKSRLRLWQNHNKSSLPENVLVYRDGVSEGQYEKVLREELPLIRKACTGMYPPKQTKDGLPRITIIIVGKRHHTRFYPTNEKDMDRSANPVHGTLVDRGVVEARNWDFFLQAHTALHGTARPAHYYIIHDEIFRGRKIIAPFQNTADLLEDLTHNLCYMYGRATTAVSINPAAYYADLACERARCYLSRLFDASEGPSAAGSDAGSNASAVMAANQADVTIHTRLRDTMFYI